MTATETADAPTLIPCATAEFSLPGGRLFTFLLLRHCFWLLTSVVLVGLAMLCIGLAADLRLSIVALMVWCFCLPLTVALCWFRYALSPLNAFNQLPHTLRFTTDSIEVHVRPKAPDRDVDDEDDVTESRESEINEELVEKVFNYPVSSIVGSEAYGGGVFLCIKEKPGGKPGYLYVPFGGDEDVQANLRVLTSRP